MPTDGTTFVSPLGIALIVAMCFLMFVLPRRYVLVPVVIITCYMTMGERVLIAGLNFTMFRILVFVGWVRMLLRGELRALKMNPIDWMLIFWVISNAVCYTILWGFSDGFVNRLGFAYNCFGLYFMFRCLILDLGDIRRLCKITAILIVPLAFFMLAEKLTAHNAFAVFGGVNLITRIRDGAIRCQGPFAHPILAGTFGATILPLLTILWWERKNRKYAILGIASAVLITIVAASSGPAFAAAAGILGIIMWKWRRYLRAVRWGIVIALVGLQMVMKAPVWFILGHAGIFAGSSGYHRADLIDNFIRHFSQWWVIGTHTTTTWGSFMGDVTNTYILQGINGGLLTLILFIWIIVRCFRGVGLTIAGMKEQSFLDNMTVWILGAALLDHTVNYISITYFDQNVINWYMLLAMIATVSGPYWLARKTAPAPAFQPAASSGLLRLKSPPKPATSQARPVAYNERFRPKPERWQPGGPGFRK